MNEKHKFRDEPLQLITIKEDESLECTVDGINFLSLLKNKQICVLSYTQSTTTNNSDNFLNTIIDLHYNEPHQSFSPELEGIWIWGKPIPLSNGKNLLLINVQPLHFDKKQKSISDKLFILTTLISNCIIYNSNDDLNETNFLSITSDLKNQIIFPSQNTNSEIIINNEKIFFPWLVIINNENKYSYNYKDNDNLNTLFPKITVVPNTDVDFINKVKNEITYKAIDNIVLDGDNLFGITQNYLDSIYNSEKPDIKLALENVLLSKAKDIGEKNVALFKTRFNETLKEKLPLNPLEIYQTFFSEEDSELEKFLKEVSDFVTIEQCSSYTIKLLQTMREELYSIIDSNTEAYDDCIKTDLEDFLKMVDSNNNINDLQNLSQTKEFIENYNKLIMDCIKKIQDIPNSVVVKNVMNFFNELVNVQILPNYNKIAEKIDKLYVTYKTKSDEEINKLKEKFAKVNESKLKSEAQLEELIKERKNLALELAELEAKYKKLTRDTKNKAKETEYNVNNEIQKYQNMETYYREQLKHKDNEIDTLNKDKDNLKAEITSLQFKYTNELNQLNKDKENLILELKQNNLNNNISTINYSFQHENTNQISTLFQNVQSSFSEFKQSLEKLEKQNETIFKPKLLEFTTKEIENKAQNWIEQIKLFKTSQINNIISNYESQIKSLQKEKDSLALEKALLESKIHNETETNNNHQQRIKSLNQNIKQIELVSNSKDDLLKIQKSEIKLLNERIDRLIKTRDELDMNLNRHMLNNKMKEDELDTMIMVIDGMLSKRKDKYEHNLKRLGGDMKAAVDILAKEYKIFK